MPRVQKMDPRYSIAVVREVRLMVNSTHPTCGECAYSVTCRSEKGIDRSKRPPDRHVGCVRTDDRDRNGHDRRDQTSARHVIVPTLPYALKPYMFLYHDAP